MRGSDYSGFFAGPLRIGDVLELCRNEWMQFEAISPECLRCWPHRIAAASPAGGGQDGRAAMPACKIALAKTGI
jgi:hypothetical protein